MSKAFIIGWLAAGCVGNKLKVEPVKVEPIHMTIDVNLHAPEPRAPAGK